MHTNPTSTSTSTSTVTDPAPASTNVTTASRPRLRTLVGSVIVVAAATFGLGAALAQESPASVPAVADHPAIAEMARSNGLTGLSPASLAPTPDVYGDSEAIADWARTHGLSGLSPASLTPVDD